jgi:glycine cleavage system H protein
MYPPDLKYTKDHEWVKLAGSEARVGITDYAQKQLGDVVYLELPEVGRQVKSGEALGEVESVKAVSDLYSPVGGEVVEVNRELVDNLERLSSDPYGDGWLVKLKLDNAAEVEKLLTLDAYQKLCEEEQH